MNLTDKMLDKVSWAIENGAITAITICAFPPIALAWYISSKAKCSICGKRSPYQAITNNDNNDNPFCRKHHTFTRVLGHLEPTYLSELCRIYILNVHKY